MVDRHACGEGRGAPLPPGGGIRRVGWRFWAARVRPPSPAQAVARAATTVRRARNKGRGRQGCLAPGVQRLRTFESRAIQKYFFANPFSACDADDGPSEVFRGPRIYREARDDGSKKGLKFRGVSPRSEVAALPQGFVLDCRATAPRPHRRRAIVYTRSTLAGSRDIFAGPFRGRSACPIHVGRLRLWVVDAWPVASLHCERMGGIAPPARPSCGLAGWTSLLVARPAARPRACAGGTAYLWVSEGGISKAHPPPDLATASSEGMAGRSAAPRGELHRQPLRPIAKTLPPSLAGTAASGG